MQFKAGTRFRVGGSNFVSNWLQVSFHDSLRNERRRVRFTKFLKTWRRSRQVPVFLVQFSPSLIEFGPAVTRFAQPLPLQRLEPRRPARHAASPSLRSSGWDPRAPVVVARVAAVRARGSFQSAAA